MKALAIAFLLTGCAVVETREPAPEPLPTYQIPVLTPDGRVDYFTVEPAPDGERMLFCIELMPEMAAVCFADLNGQAQRYVFPLAPIPEEGT